MSVAIERRGFSLPLGVSPEAEIFAVGDIHGRSDLLAALIDEAAREPKLRDKRVIVFLGDLVDRGSDSLGAIDLAMAAKARVGADEAIALMGNHETMMRLALDPETPWDDAIDAFETWLANGGDRTVAEFLKTERAARRSRRICSTHARASLPPRVLRWLSSLRPSWRSGEVLFVHAGVNPQVELETFLAAPWNTPLAISSTKIVTGPGCAGHSSSIGRRWTASAASSSSMATRRTTPVATPRTRIRSPDSASISTRVRR